MFRRYTVVQVEVTVATLKLLLLDAVIIFWNAISVLNLLNVIIIIIIILYPKVITTNRNTCNGLTVRQNTTKQNKNEK